MLYNRYPPQHIVKYFTNIGKKSEFIKKRERSDKGSRSVRKSIRAVSCDFSCRDMNTK